MTIQAQYLRLLKDIQRETNLALVFVTHDLGIVAKLCDRVAVMYAGRIVETGTTREIFSRPRHPYTIGLLNCLPTLRRGREPLTAIDGQPPDLAAVPAGCAFAPRCALAEDRCSQTRPGLEPVGAEHLVACLRADETATLMPRRAAVTTVAETVAAPVPDGDVVLEARGLTKHFPVSRGAIFSRDGRHREGGGRRELRPAPGRDARARGRERVRQDDHGAAGAVPGAPDGRGDLLSRSRRPRARRGPSCASIAAPCRPCSRIPTARSTRA